MRTLLLFFFSVALVLPAAEARVERVKKKSAKITSETGLNIPAWGVAVDAVYDSRLDSLIPGYKILNVVLSNRGTGVIYLDPTKDKWVIVDNMGRRETAINHLRQDNEKLWNSLPEGLRQKLEYPQAVRVGNSTKIDLFFPAKNVLSGFREIKWESAHFNREFNIFTAGENLELESNEEPLPKRKSEAQALEKYEGKEEERTNPPPQARPALEPLTIPMD